MTSKKIAAVILTKNAASQIENCLKSVYGWADEIIIVDGQSTDPTLEICKKYTHQIFIRPFQGSFSEDRNFGADQAKSDWILQLDADEIVPKDFKEKFETIRNTPRHSVYKTFRENYFLGNCMKTWNHQIQILYLKSKARFHGHVHERLDIQGSVGTLPTHIEHYPFQTLHQWLERHNRYTDLFAKELFETHGILPWKKVRRNLYYKPFKTIWKLYVIKRGYRDGWHGFIFSVLYGFEHFLKWAKYWELTRHAK